MAKKKVKQESQWIREIAYIMKVHKGPFTKMMILEELEQLHPDMYKQELLVQISCAILDDKLYNTPQRFKISKQGWWDLADREDDK